MPTHVISLAYDFTSLGGDDFSRASPLTFSNELGRFELREQRLTFWPQSTFASVDGAREAVASFLKSWELEAFLSTGIDSARFTFAGAELAPEILPDGSTVVHLQGIAAAAFASEATVVVTRASYPRPPKVFEISEQVEIASRRWAAYRAGRETLLAASYAILTLIEAIGERAPVGKSGKGSRKQAADALSIELMVLATLGRFTSEHGSPHESRKLNLGSLLELTHAQRSWIEAAVPRLISQVHEISGGLNAEPLGMANLPPIGP